MFPIFISVVVVVTSCTESLLVETISFGCMLLRCCHGERLNLSTVFDQKLKGFLPTMLFRIFHHSLHLDQWASSTSRKTTSKHNAANSMLHCGYKVLLDVVFRCSKIFFLKYDRKVLTFSHTFKETFHVELPKEARLDYFLCVKNQKYDKF